MAIAKDSPQGLDLYATFRRWPNVVPHLSAKALRSETGIDFQKAFRSMPPFYHKVMKKQAPNSSFTKECGFATIADMQNQDAEVRRTNLKRLIERDFGGNISRAAREYGAGQNYLSALLKDGKSFGEKTARKIEDKLGLLDRQLDIPQSPLAHDHNRRDRTNDELHLVIAELSMDDKKELLAHGRRLRAKNRLRPTG